MRARTLILSLAVLAATLAAPASAKRTFVYVHDRQAGGGIYGFQLGKDGTLAALPGSPFPSPDVFPDQDQICIGMCQTMEYSPKRKVLVTGGPAGVTVWLVAKDGTLTVVPGSPFGPGSGDFLGTTVAQIGKQTYVYSAAFGDDAVYGFQLQSDGRLTDLASSPTPAGVGPDGVAARKSLLFVANEGFTDVDGDSTVSSYVVGKDGGLTSAPGSPLSLPSSLFSFNVTPDKKGKRLYVPDAGNQIFGFAVDKKTAALSPIPGSPFAGAFTNGPFGLVTAKKLAYGLGYNDTDDEFQPFSVGKKGALTDTGIIVTAPIVVDAGAIDSKAKRLVFAGPDLVVSARVADKQGGLDTSDAVPVLDVNANAVVFVKR